MSCVQITVEGSATREHVLDSLVPAAPYDIYMVAFNSAGQSQPSKSVTGYTLSKHREGNYTKEFAKKILD